MSFQDELKIEMVKIHNTYVAVRKFESCFGETSNRDSIMRNLPVKELKVSEFIVKECK